MPQTPGMVHLMVNAVAIDVIPHYLVYSRLAKTVPLELKESWLSDRDRDICPTGSQIDRTSFTRLLQMDNMLTSSAIVHHSY